MNNKNWSHKNKIIPVNKKINNQTTQMISKIVKYHKKEPKNHQKIPWFRKEKASKINSNHIMRFVGNIMLNNYKNRFKNMHLRKNKSQDKQKRKLSTTEVHLIIFHKMVMVLDNNNTILKNTLRDRH